MKRSNGHDAVALVASDPDLLELIRAGLSAAHVGVASAVVIDELSEKPARKKPEREKRVATLPVKSTGASLLVCMKLAPLGTWLDVVDRATPHQPVFALRLANGPGDRMADVERALLRRRGALVVQTPEELVEVARVFAHAPRLSRNIALVASQPSLRPVVAALAADLGLAGSAGPAGHDAPKEAPVVVRIPEDVALLGARPRLAAMRLLGEHLAKSPARGTRPHAPPAGAKTRALQVLAACELTLTEREARDIFALYGIASSPDEIVRSGSAAATAARRVGFPASLRVITPDVRDVDQIGGVAASVMTSAQARGAYIRVLVAASQRAPQARLEGVLVTKAPPAGVRLRISTVDHGALGISVTVDQPRTSASPAPGAPEHERISPRTVRLAPVSVAEARSMILESPVADLLLARASEPPDIDALAAVISKTSTLAMDLREATVENELVVVVRPRAEGCAVVHANVLRRG